MPLLTACTSAPAGSSDASIVDKIWASSAVKLRPASIPGEPQPAPSQRGGASYGGGAVPCMGRRGTGAPRAFLIE
eukprot:COSAG01_NODE_3921_length_5535_cov_44.878933_2_plen_75_part_00